MKKILFFATAFVALAACTDDAFIGDQNLNIANERGGTDEIVFGTGLKRLTRSGDITGSTAAGLLNYEFVFAGTKGTPTGDPAVIANFVFDQYKAKWVANTANTTESNSNDWEYVGYTPAETNTIIAGGSTTTQTIKYWDYSTPQYDFAAYSLGAAIDHDNDALTDPETATATAIDKTSKSYTLTGTAEQLKNCYISDLVTAYNHDGVGDYGKVVNFKFRSLATKVRLAFYETVPGYSVKDVKFYTSSTAALATDGTESDPTLFTSTAVLPSGSGTMTVTFPTKGWDDRNATDYNKAHVSFAQKSGVAAASTLVLEDLDDLAAAENKETAGNTYLGRASNTATYAGGLESGSGMFYTILPYETGANLQLRIKYTLVSTDGSGEEITVDNASAVIPAELAQWNPNYAYTYIFKISDMTNGTTGFGPDGTTPVTGLTPITLNAVVVDSEDGVQETITTVYKPSITTYMLGKVVTDNDEYVVNGTHPIYVVVNNGTANEILYKATNTSADPAEYANAKLYTATVESGALQGITEETVDNALRYGVVSGSTYTVTDAEGKALVVTDVTESKLTAKVTKMLAEDSPTGNEITMNCATFVPETGKTYIFQYVKNASTTTPAVYAAVNSVTKLTSGTKYYTSTTDETGFTADGHELIDGVYYTKSGDVFVLVTGVEKLTAGQTYYTAESDASIFTATGNELVGGTYYTKDGSTYTAVVSVTKLTAGQTYYTSNRGAGKFTAAGTETIVADKYWTQTSAGVPGEYVYKIIKVE